MSASVGAWTESAGIPTNRLNRDELAEMDRLIQLRSQAVEFSEDQTARYGALLSKARGEEAAA